MGLSLCKKGRGRSSSCLDLPQQMVITSF